METNAQLLSESGPLHMALVDLGVKLSDLHHAMEVASNDQDGEIISKTEVQLGRIHENLQQFSQSSKALQEACTPTFTSWQVRQAIFQEA